MMTISKKNEPDYNGFENYNENEPDALQNSYPTETIQNNFSNDIYNNAPDYDYAPSNQQPIEQSQVPFFQPADFARQDSTSDQMSTSRSAMSSSYGNNGSSNDSPYSQPQYVNDQQYVNEASNQQYTAEEVEEEEDLFGGFSKKKLTINEDGQTSKTSTPAKPQTKKQAANTPKKGWFGGIISKLTGNKEVFLPDDKDKSLYYDKTLGKWVDKNADEEEVKAPPPPPPMGNFAPKSTVTPAMSVPTPIPSQPVPSNIPTIATNNQSFSPSPSPMSSARKSREEKRQQQKTLLQMTKSSTAAAGTGTTVTNEDEQEKPAGPPSRFSLKASGGGRRGRYVNVLGGNNTAMKPLVDPMATNNLPAANPSTNQMTFFNPAMMQQ